MKDILVSVIIPNYNHDKYLEKRLDSVFNQTYQNIEVIILDDKSTDDSLIVINKYKDNPKLAKIVVNQQNSGTPFSQWNKGVKMARGEYIWIAESDDWAEITFVEKMIDFILQDAQIGLVFCNTTIVYQIENTTANTRDDHRIHFTDKPFYNSNIVDGKYFFFNYFSQYCAIPNVSAVIFRKEAIIKANYTDENMKNAGDWKLYFNILTNYKIAYINENLNYWRRHFSNTTKVNDNLKLESLSIVKMAIDFQRKNNFKVTRHCLEAYFIWCFYDAFWRKDKKLTYKNLFLYIKNANFVQIKFLIFYHFPDMIKLVLHSLKNKFYKLTHKK